MKKKVQKVTTMIRTTDKVILMIDGKEIKGIKPVFYQEHELSLN